MMLTKSKDYYKEFKIEKIEFHDDSIPITKSSINGVLLNDENAIRMNQASFSFHKDGPNTPGSIAVLKRNAKVNVQVQMSISDKLNKLNELGGEMSWWSKWLRTTFVAGLCIFIYSQNAHLFLEERHGSQSQNFMEQTLGPRLSALMEYIMPFYFQQT